MCRLTKPIDLTDGRGHKKKLYKTSNTKAHPRTKMLKML